MVEEEVGMVAHTMTGVSFSITTSDFLHKTSRNSIETLISLPKGYGGRGGGGYGGSYNDGGEFLFQSLLQTFLIRDFF